MVWADWHLPSTPPDSVGLFYRLETTPQVDKCSFVPSDVAPMEYKQLGCTLSGFDFNRMR